MLWIYDIPTWLLGVLIVVVFTSLSVAGLFATRRIVEEIAGPRPGHNEGVDAYIATASVFYGLVAGLIAVAAWEQFSNLDDKVSHEAADLASLYRSVVDFRQPYGTILSEQLRTYTRHEIEAWPQFEHGVISTTSADDLKKFRALLYTFDPKTVREQIIFASALSQFDTLIELRRERLHSKDAGLPAALWSVVLIGGVLTIVLTYFLALERFRVHVVMTVVCGFMVSLLIFMIAAVDHPFRGEVSIGPGAFQLTYDEVMMRY